MIYNGSYLFPPRAERKINPIDIEKYDNGDFLCQPKYNGSAVVIILDGQGGVKVSNRHNEAKTKLPATIDFAGIHRGEGSMVVCGELMEKNKKGEDGQPFNHVVILWDILVYGGKFLHGSTFEERMDLMDNLFPASYSEVSDDGMKIYQHVQCTSVRGVYKSPTFVGYLCDLYKDLVKTDAYEGLVLKKRRAKLDFCFNEGNNSSWQLKVRKPTKNYSF